MPRTWWAVAALLALLLLAYSNSFNGGFPLDSRGLILDSARVHAVTADNLRAIFEHTYWWPVGESGLYRPFTTLSYLFSYAVLGDGESPQGYHWINFALHSLNVVFLWLLARRLLDRFWPPVFVAAVWAVHPVLTESVTNIAGRADLLAGASTLGGLWMYLKSTETAGWRRAAWLAGLFAATTIGVFSKESAVIILALIPLLAWTRRASRGLLWGCLAVLPPILAMLYQRSAVLRGSAPTRFPFFDNPLTGADFWTARLTGVKVIGRYLGLLLWPAQLSCDYSYAQIPMVTGSQQWLIWLAVAAAAASAIVLNRVSRTGFFVAAAAFVVFLPTSNLLFQFGTIMAERFLYLPSIAFAALLVWAAYALSARLKSRSVAPAILCAIVAAFAARTLLRNADWQDDLTLSEAAVRVSPASFKTHMLRANALLAADPSHGNLDQVIAESDQAIAILDPLHDVRNDADAYQRAAGYHLMQGDRLRRADPAAAVPAWQRSLALFERCRAIASATQSTGLDLEPQIVKLYLRLDRPADALAAAFGARALNPSDPQRHRVVAGLLLDAGREHEAAIALVTGMIVTHDAALAPSLHDLAPAGLDAKGCAAAWAEAGKLTGRPSATPAPSTCPGSETAPPRPLR
jgi:hypothetical protein